MQQILNTSKVQKSPIILPELVNFIKKTPNHNLNSQIPSFNSTRAHKTTPQLPTPQTPPRKQLRFSGTSFAGTDREADPESAPE